MARLKTPAMDEKTQSPDTNVPESGDRSETPGSFLRFILLVALAALAFRSFAFSLFNIPSESMLPRLMNGDYLVASKWPYGFTSNSLPFDLPIIPGRWFAAQPERGDIVIFKHPIDGTDYVKRAIGLPGDTVEMRRGQVILNGEPLPRVRLGDFRIPVSANTRCSWGASSQRQTDGRILCSYTRYRERLPGGRTYETLDFGRLPQDDFAEVTVPEGAMFLMGDNRDNSQDSRFRPEAAGGVGLVPQALLVGRAESIVFSTDGGAEWLRPGSWFSATRWQRIGDGL